MKLEHRSGGAAHPGHVGGHRQAARPRQGLGLPRDQGGRQLRRDLRAQRRAEVGAEAAARRQQPVEQGRPACTRRRCARRTPRPDAAGTARRVRLLCASGRRPAADFAKPRWRRMAAPSRSASDGPGAARRFAACCLPDRRASLLVVGGRLVPRSQHAGEHARARHPERLRFPAAARRLRDRREPLRVRLGRNATPRPS